MLKYWNRLNNFIDNPIIVDARIVNEDIHSSKDYIIHRDANESDWIFSTLD